MIACFLGIAAGALVMIHQWEPVYHDHPISYWIEPWQHRGTPEAVIEAAFAEMDDWAVIWLIDQLDWQPSRLKTRLNRAVRSVMSAKFFEDAPDRREVAAMALMRLGHRARRAIPGLEAAAQSVVEPRSWSSRGAALGALIRIRGDNIDPYLVRMKGASIEEWGVLALALGNQGTNADAAVPLLTEALTMRSSNLFALPAINALGSIRSRPEQSVPVLTQCLTNANSMERMAAANALAQFGRAAKSSWSELTNCWKTDSDQLTRLTAACALISIDDQKAHAFGIIFCPLMHAHPLP